MRLAACWRHDGTSLQKDTSMANGKPFSELIGQQVATLAHDDGSVTINGIKYDAVGDCCSMSWIEHWTEPPDVIGATITNVTEPALDPHAPVEEQDGESIAVYHTAIATTRGEIVIEYRNSSNGYYGGWLERVY